MAQCGCFEVLVLNIYTPLLSYRVSLEDLYNGKTTKLQLSKNVICGACNG